MTLNLIAAMAKNRVIGVDNKLPWNIPEDLQFFKEKTKGKILLMGRKTFESLPKPLPGRLHIVITRDQNYKVEHPLVHIVHTIDEAIKLAPSFFPTYTDEVFIVGGGEIYKQTLDIANRIYLTVVEKDFAGDAIFPEFNLNKFKKIEERASQLPDHSLEYKFQTFEQELR
jgi:dihydrofolate reductase